ncbi:MAG TPA: TonB-dependent receptor [Acidobacteriaceae bacterium]|nr:TonB-dependent receptor [Acidobacteriaceae bacterium]
MTKRCSAVALSLFLVACTVTAFAQMATTSLRGVIKDPSGAVIPGAHIALLNGATGQAQNAISSAAGEYTFVSLEPAKYTIKVSATGFGDQTKAAELLVNQPATIDFTMTLKAISEVVNVSAEAQTLNTTDASLGNSEGNALIQALPSETRNVPDLLSLQPGVLYLPTMGASEANPGGDSRSGTVNGVRSDQGNVTLDGVDDNDQVYGYAFTGVLRETQDSVEEFRVSTANSNADEGRSAGAQVSLVTKSGSNSFHGAAYEYNRPTLTVANDWFNKQAELNTHEPNIPPKLIRNIFGAAVGGPIIKDKLFFFGNYEGTRQAENTQVTQTVPTAAYAAGKLSYQGDDASGNIVNVVLTPSQVATLDAGCQVCHGANDSGYAPGPGPNPNALAYFAAMPVANGFTEGDGLNEGSFSFSSPNPVTLNTSIVRLDYTPNQQHRIFVRGNLQKDTTIGTENFPGQGPSSYYEDNTKGVIGGDTWSISPNLVNDVRYGYIRQGNSLHGVGDGDYVDFRFLSSPTAESRTTLATVPVNNIVDNLNWNKGKHDFQIGANWRLIHQNRTSDANSYNSASTNPYWVGGDAPDPSTITGYPVDGGFGNSYGIAYANLVGIVPSVTNQYNYLLGNGSGTLLADGAFVTRHFKSNEFEYYVQDAWKPIPNLTITFGLRHTILQTPWETHGQEVTPTIDTHSWFLEREAAAQQGQIYEPELSFAPAGPYYNKPGFWPKQKANIAPRFAIAYAPTSRTTIRAGAGIYFDHYGESLINLFDQSGAFGLSGAVTNPAGTYGYEDSPRFTGRSTLPFSNGTFPNSPPYPFAPPTGAIEGFSITWGLDSRLKTPYTEAFNLSVQHQFPKGFTLETDYVGTLGRHLIQSLDLAEPVDFVDPGGGGDYFHAGAQLSRLVDQHNGNYENNGNYASPSVPSIKYFEDVFPWMANYDYPGESATQAIYNNEWAPYRYDLGATTSLADLDFYGPPSGFGFYPAPGNWQPHFWQGQFSSLYALSTIGSSYYNSLQVTVRHPSSHGLEFDVSYTLSHSIDLGSDSERSTEFSTSTALSSIINSWSPQFNRGSSDFDTRQLLTVDGVYALPFGRGRQLLGNTNRVTNFLLGGWQLSGINRTTSGLPFTLFEPGWTTNWQQEGYGVVTGKVPMRRHFDQYGDPQFFADAASINSNVTSGHPVRLPYPGEAGERNNFRGDGYFDIDAGLAKSWTLREYGALKFAWETYNTTNTVRFDPNSIGSGLTGGNLGVASALLTQPRRMQFSLRYDF